MFVYLATWVTMLSNVSVSQKGLCSCRALICLAYFTVDVIAASACFGQMVFVFNRVLSQALAFWLICCKLVLQTAMYMLDQPAVVVHQLVCQVLGLASGMFRTSNL